MNSRNDAAKIEFHETGWWIFRDGSTPEEKAPSYWRDLSTTGASRKSEVAELLILEAKLQRDANVYRP